MVTYKQYVEKAKSNNFTIIPEKEWVELSNEIRKNKAYFKRMDLIDDVRQENLLLKIGALKNDRSIQIA